MRVWMTLVLVGMAAVAQAAPKIEFAGNGRISSTELLAAIDDPFDANGRLVEDVFERDLLKISAYYWDRGYARVKVGAPVISPAVIRIPITEGERFTLANVTVREPAGARDARTKVRHALQVRAGDVFSRSALAAERERLSRYYEERGYAFVTVLPVTKIDVDNKTIAVTFEIERGKQARLERIDVTCPAIPRAASAPTVGVGDLFDIAQVDASKRAIATAGALDPDRVVVTIERGATDEQVRVGFRCQ